MTIDKTYISRMVLISHALRLAQMIVIILTGSYFAGLGWFLYSEATGDLVDDDNFIITFGFDSKSNTQKMVALTYFVITSLTTVGFGDLHPRSNAERALGAFLLLFGVAITSYVTEHLMSMIKTIRESDKPYEEEDSLSEFFGTLEQFNNDKPLTSEVVK